MLWHAPVMLPPPVLNHCLRGLQASPFFPPNSSILFNQRRDLRRHVQSQTVIWEQQFLPCWLAFEVMSIKCPFPSAHSGSLAIIEPSTLMLRTSVTFPRLFQNRGISLHLRTVEPPGIRKNNCKRIVDQMRRIKKTNLLLFQFIYVLRTNMNEEVFKMGTVIKKNRWHFSIFCVVFEIGP